MNIKHNEIDNSIEIRDGLNKQYFFLNLILILNVFNSFVWLYDTNGKSLGVIEIIWALAGITSLIILFFLNFKKSSQKNIPTKNIKRLLELTVFWEKKIFVTFK